MLRKTILAISVLTLAACGGGGGGGNTSPTGSTTSTPSNNLENITIKGSLTTTTVNKTQKVNLLVEGSNHTVYIQTPIGTLDIDGSLNKIDFANGVTVDTCKIKGSNNTATKSDLLTLNCTIDGSLNKGF